MDSDGLRWNIMEPRWRPYLPTLRHQLQKSRRSILRKSCEGHPARENETDWISVEKVCVCINKYIYIYIYICSKIYRECQYYSWMLKLLKAPRALKISFSSTRHATDFYAYSAKRCTVKCANSRKDRWFPHILAEWSGGVPQNGLCVWKAREIWGGHCYVSHAA